MHAKVLPRRASDRNPGMSSAKGPAAILGRLVCTRRKRPFAVGSIPFPRRRLQVLAKTALGDRRFPLPTGRLHAGDAHTVQPCLIELGGRAISTLTHHRTEEFTQLPFGT